MAEDEEYELLPHKEIEELKKELAHLKEFEMAPSKKMQVSLLELNKKLDKLITIFEDAAHEMRVEEGSLRFKEKMSPILEKLSKITEQNSEIAEGILALADMLKEGKPPETEAPEAPPGLPPLPSQEEPGMGQEGQGQMPAPPGQPPITGPPGQPPQTAGMPTPARPAGQEQPGQGLPLPPMPKKRTFGL